MSSISLNALLQVARTGLLTQQFSIESISNNIANINTVGYKHSRAEFSEILSRVMQPPPAGSNRAAGQAAGAGLAANQRLFDQGQIEPTDRPWDLAIVGEGFFQIRMPDGSAAYTRDGGFRLDGEGRLTTADGYYMSPEIAVPPDAEDVVVTPAGEIMVRRRGETEPQTIATLTLARFINPAGLESIGDNLYNATAASGDPLVAEPQVEGMGRLISGALEQSNVDLSQEMVELISAQRAYSLMTRALKNSDQMLSLVNQMRG